MDLETAKQIVKQFFRNAEDPSLTDLLESSRSTDDYRPYFVAASLIWADYQQLTKADDVSFNYDKRFAVEGLLTTQSVKDCGMNGIPECYTVDSFLNHIASISDTHQPSFLISGM